MNSWRQENKRAYKGRGAIQGWVPRPAGRGGFPAPPRLARKNDQSRREVAGQNKGPILKSFQREN